MDENHHPPISGHLESPQRIPARIASPITVAAYGQTALRRSTEEADLISPWFALRVLAQWWYVIVPISLVLAAVSSGVMYMTFVPMYRASATLHIAGQTPYVAYYSNEPSLKSEEFIETQIELLTSDMVLEPVVGIPVIASIEEFRSREDSAGWLSKQIKVSQVGKSELYRVSFASPIPENAAVVVNAVIDEFFKVRRITDESRTNRVIELLNRERGVLSANIQKDQQQMRELHQQAYGTDVGMPIQGSASGGRRPFDVLQEKLINTVVDIKLRNAEIQALEEDVTNKEVPLSATEIEMAISESAEVLGMRSLLVNKQQTLQEYERSSARGKSDPGYKRLEQDYQQLETQLQSAVAAARTKITTQHQQMNTLARQDSLEQMKADLDKLMRQEATLREEHETKKKELLAADKSLELEFMRSELERKQRVLDVISERAMELQTERQAPGRVTLQRAAIPPSSPVERLPLRNLSLAVLACTFLPFGLVLLWELSIRRISDAEQLTDKAHLAVLGEVAVLPLRSRIGSRRSFGRGLSLFEESIDSLRVCLWLSESRKHVHTLAVCSAIHGEGKTSVASQLSVSIARTMSEPVLLIDADMRAPDIHQIFSIPREPGLADVLDGRCSIDSAIFKEWSDKLHVLPAGRLTKSPHKMLAGDGFAQLLAQLRTNYRCIIIDTPPVLSASEALLLAKMADGAIVCTRRNYSRERQVRLAYERLLSAGARPLGAVFNAVPARQYASTYGSYDYARMDLLDSR